MAKKNYHSQFVDFDSGYAPVSNALRRSQTWHSLTPVEKLVYQELLATYFSLGRPKDYFAWPYSKVIDRISKPAWFKAVKVLTGRGFIVLHKEYKHQYKLSNLWQGKNLYNSG